MTERPFLTDVFPVVDRQGDLDVSWLLALKRNVI